MDDITRLLRNAAEGDSSSSQALYAEVYSELRGLAARAMRRERQDHTLQPTALVNEAWIRLVSNPEGWESRAALLRASAQLMREILIDHARHRGRLKRGGDRMRVELRDPVALAVYDPETMLLLDSALEKLGKLDPRSRQVVELRYFAGLSAAETAEVMSLAVKTVTRDWNFARAWLEKEIRG